MDLLPLSVLQVQLLLVIGFVPQFLDHSEVPAHSVDPINIQTSPLHRSDALFHKLGDGGVFSVAQSVQVAAEHVISDVSFLFDALQCRPSLEETSQFGSNSPLLRVS